MTYLGDYVYTTDSNIISYVEKSFERLGLRVGDVVTHVDGEVFDGNIEKLRFLLAMKKRDSSSVDIVLNADPGVADDGHSNNGDADHTDANDGYCQQ